MSTVAFLPARWAGAQKTFENESIRPANLTAFVSVSGSLLVEGNGVAKKTLAL